MEKRYFIRDCNKSIVGNPAGYRTMADAQRVASNRRGSAYKAITAAIDACTDEDRVTVYSIKLEG